MPNHLNIHLFFITPNKAFTPANPSLTRSSHLKFTFTIDFFSLPETSLKSLQKLHRFKTKYPLIRIIYNPLLTNATKLTIFHPLLQKYSSI